MTKRRRYLISAAVLATCVCVALGVLAMLPPRPEATKANFSLIENGMTRAEVEAILGSPSRSDIWLEWESDDGLIAIEFNRDNKVVEKGMIPSADTIFDKLRRWLHLPK